MHTEKREDPLVEMGYEIRDAKISQIGRYTLYFFIFVIVMIATGWVVLFGFGPIPGMNPMYAKKNSGYNEVRRVPQDPNPVLQTNVSARTDMSDLRKTEFARLKGTGYANEARSKVYIPIDRAMDALVNGGLPPAEDAAAVTKGTTDDKMNVDDTESMNSAMDRMNKAENAAVEKFGPGQTAGTPKAENHDGHNHAEGESH